MDLFGFAKDVGRRLFNTEDDAVDKIRELIEENNPGVTNLGVEFDGGIVSLSGECESAAAMQQCALLAGNVQGVADVYVNRMTVKPPPTPVQSPDVAAAAATPAAEAEPAGLSPFACCWPAVSPSSPSPMPTPELLSP